jgi:hypothetical protein
MTIAIKTPADHDSIMVAVTSSNMRRIGFIEPSSTLIIDFLSGTYVFEGVSLDLHDKLMQAESKGSFFAKHIKNKFETTKLPNPAHRECAAVNSLAATS